MFDLNNYIVIQPNLRYDYSLVMWKECCFMQRELTIDGWYVTNVRKVNNEVYAQIWRYTRRVGYYMKKQGNINIKFVNENIKSEFILIEEIWNNFIDSKLDFIKPKPYVFSTDLVRINKLLTKGLKRFVVEHNFILFL